VNSPASRSAPRAADPGRPWYDYAERVLPETRGRWVDLGCGQGEFVERARSSADRDALALDLTVDNARGASLRGAQALAADLTRDLPFADGSLDGASLIEVIEHIPSAERLVGELARVIAPGGWLVVTTPNVAHLTYRIRALTGHPPKQEGYHFRFFTTSTLRALLESHGFRLEARESFGKQALLTKLGRLAGRERSFKFRYRVPEACESLLAQHFVWRLRRI